METFEQLLNAMGERLEIGVRPLEREYDPLHRRSMAERSPEERLALAISWNRLAGRLTVAGSQARERRDPAATTRR